MIIFLYFSYKSFICGVLDKLVSFDEISSDTKQQKKKQPNHYDHDDVANDVANKDLSK